MAEWMCDKDTCVSSNDADAANCSACGELRPLVPVEIVGPAQVAEGKGDDGPVEADGDVLPPGGAEGILAQAAGAEAGAEEKEAAAGAAGSGGGSRPRKTLPRMDPEEALRAFAESVGMSVDAAGCRRGGQWDSPLGCPWACAS